MDMGMGLLAAGEPAVALMPNVLDYATAAALVAPGGACRAEQPGFIGAGAWRINVLLLGLESQACKCVLPTGMGTSTSALAVGQSVQGVQGQLAPENLCFNANCASNPPYLYVDLPSLLQAPTTGAVCPAACGKYLAALETGTTDLGNVNAVALEEFCGISPASAAATLVPSSAMYVAAGVLACVAAPVLYLAVLAASLVKRAREGTPFRDTLAARPAFFGSCVAVCVVLCLAFAYFWTDCRGVRACTGRSAPDADGFTFPAAHCLSAGYFAAPRTTAFGTTLPALVPQYVLPEEFCSAEPSYCQCDNATLLMCAADGCGCTSTQCCSVSGICTSPDLARVSSGTFAGVVGLSNRPVRLQVRSSSFSLLTMLVCVCVCLAVVPACVTAAVYGAPAATRPWVRVAVGVALAVILGVACFGPVFYRLAAPLTVTRAGVGACPRLTDYPDTLVETTRPNIVFARTDRDDAAGRPTYARTPSTCAACCTAPLSSTSTSTSTLTSSSTSSSTSSFSASSSACAVQQTAACPPECTCTWTATQGCFSSPPPVLAYDDARQRWTMTSSSGTGPVLHNVLGTGVLYQDAEGRASRPTLYASFTDDANTAELTYTFCGQLDGGATCTTCTCSP